MASKEDEIYYKSTRGDPNPYTFEEAVCNGYAPDGGLFVPSHLPQITQITLNKWKTLSYPELATQILRNFIPSDELSNQELSDICHSSLQGFENKNHPVVVTPLNDTTFVSELFHGPTMCFKDFGLQFLIRVTSHYCSKRQKARTILVATTGDTGPAALSSVTNTNNPLLSIIIHYPYGQISNFQRKQLTTVESKRHYVVAFEGGGDDMDIPIKNLLRKQNQSSSAICGVNSYNIARPLFQMVHFIWTYLRILEQKPKLEQVDYIIPTGAMGNIVAAYMAKLMGVPIGILCAAVNINDVSHRVICTGEFYKSGDMYRTLSEAINIQLPYNFERLLYYISNQDSSYIKKIYTQLEQSTSTKIILEPNIQSKLQTFFKSARITDEEMSTALKHTLKTYNYLCDPNTSIAIAGAMKLDYLSQDKIACIFATASPCKFKEVIEAVCGEDIWDEYYNSSHFPKMANEILKREEVEPVFYERSDGMELGDVQVIWEKNTLELIDRLVHS